MVFQSYAVWPHMTVFGNVAYGLRARKFPTHEIDDRVRAILATVRLDDLAKRYPWQLSGGQQQRSEEHTSELQSLMRISYAVFCLKKKRRIQHHDRYYSTIESPPNNNTLIMHTP